MSHIAWDETKEAKNTHTQTHMKIIKDTQAWISRHNFLVPSMMWPWGTRRWWQVKIIIIGRCWQSWPWCSCIRQLIRWSALRRQAWLIWMPAISFRTVRISPLYAIWWRLEMLGGLISLRFQNRRCLICWRKNRTNLSIRKNKYHNNCGSQQTLSSYGQVHVSFIIPELWDITCKIPELESVF